MVPIVDKPINCGVLEVRYIKIAFSAKNTGQNDSEVSVLLRVQHNSITNQYVDLNVFEIGKEWT
jgi:hypothetical protein